MVDQATSTVAGLTATLVTAGILAVTDTAAIPPEWWGHALEVVTVAVAGVGTYLLARGA